MKPRPVRPLGTASKPQPSVTSPSMPSTSISSSSPRSQALRSPRRSDPAAHPEEAEERRNVVYTMLDNGHITQEEYDAAVATPVASTLLSEPQNGCSAAGISAYFCDYVINQALEDESWGTDWDDRVGKLYLAADSPFRPRSIRACSKPLTIPSRATFRWAMIPTSRWHSPASSPTPGTSRPWPRTPLRWRQRGRRKLDHDPQPQRRL